MFRINWNNPKVTIEDVEQVVSVNLGSIYDGLLVENGFLYVVTTEPMSSEQEDIVKNLIYNLNDMPSTVTTTNEVILNWSQLKTFYDANSAYCFINYIDLTSSYYIWLTYKDQKMYIPELTKGTDDCNVFEASYKSICNIKPFTDTDGVPLSRVKQTITGWTYQWFSFECYIAKLNSIYSLNYDGSSISGLSMKFYEGSVGSETQITGDNLNQDYLDSHCTMTVIDWEPTYDYDIVVGRVHRHEDLTSDVRIWIVAVPDIPANYGGSKIMCNGGFNLKTHDITMDGRVAKHLVYSSTYHTNKMRSYLRHESGYKGCIGFSMELFKA